MQMRLSDVKTDRGANRVRQSQATREHYNGDRPIWPIKRDYLKKPFNHELAMELRGLSLITREQYCIAKNDVLPTRNS